MQTAHLLKHQIDFITDTTTESLGLVSGYRGGKTHALCYKAIYLSSLNSKYPGALLEPTGAMITKVLVPTLESILDEMKIPSVYHKSDSYYDIKLGSNTRRIYLLSAENYTRNRGLSLSYFGIDELDAIKKDVAEAAWNMMTSRLTAGEAMQAFCCSTPEGFSFMYNFFIVNAAPDRKLIKACTLDNPFISPKYLDRMKATHTEKQLQAYIYGEFVNFVSGNVYYAYDRDLNASSETLAKHPHAPLNIGIDFNKRKMATIIAIIINGRSHVVKEIYGSANTEALINDIRKTVGPNRLIRCFVDASGNTSRSDFTLASQTDVMQLKMAFGQDNVRHYKGNIPVLDRVGQVNAHFCAGDGQRRLLINYVECPVLARCIETQGMVDGKPDKSNDIDHMPDALGYFISYVFPSTKHSAKIQVIS